MSGYAFHDDRQLVANLAALNEQLSHYMVRLLDADAGRAEPVSVADERVLAEAVRVMADRLQERADRHAASSTPPVPEGSAIRRRPTNSRPSERC